MATDVLNGLESTMKQHCKQKKSDMPAESAAGDGNSHATGTIATRHKQDMART